MWPQLYSCVEWLTHPREQAESELSDEKQREELDAIVKQARNLVLKNLNLPTTIKDDDARLKDVAPPFKQQLRAKSKELLIDEEVRRRKYGISFPCL